MVEMRCKICQSGSHKPPPILKFLGKLAKILSISKNYFHASLRNPRPSALIILKFPQFCTRQHSLPSPRHQSKAQNPEISHFLCCLMPSSSRTSPYLTKHFYELAFVFAVRGLSPQHFQTPARRNCTVIRFSIVKSAFSDGKKLYNIRDVVVFFCEWKILHSPTG